MALCFYFHTQQLVRIICSESPSEHSNTSSRVILDCLTDNCAIVDTQSVSILRSQEENSFDHYICVLLDVCMRMEVGVAYILVFCWFSCFVLLLIFIELFVGLFWVFFLPTTIS